MNQSSFIDSFDDSPLARVSFLGVLWCLIVLSDGFCLQNIAADLLNRDISNNNFLPGFSPEPEPEVEVAEVSSLLFFASVLKETLGLTCLVPQTQAHKKPRLENNAQNVDNAELVNVSFLRLLLRDFVD